MMGRFTAWLIAVIMVPAGIVMFVLPGYYEANGYISGLWALLTIPCTIVFIVVGMFAYEIAIDW